MSEYRGQQTFFLDCPISALDRYGGFKYLTALFYL